MAQVQWYKVALCLPLMANFGKLRQTGCKISYEEIAKIAKHHKQALPISF
jgi:hypothetical protein